MGTLGAGIWWATGLVRDIRMPAMHDRRLVGHWMGKKGERPVPRFRDIEFLSNGTAFVPGMSQFRWGTDKGILHLVGRASGTDWLNGVYAYRVGPKSRSIKFNTQPFGMLPAQLMRR